jgi:hypothetical protein
MVVDPVDCVENVLAVLAWVEVIPLEDAIVDIVD